MAFDPEEAVTNADITVVNFLETAVDMALADPEKCREYLTTANNWTIAINGNQIYCPDNRDKFVKRYIDAGWSIVSYDYEKGQSVIKLEY